MTLHMSPEEFRLRGHEVIDWIADYYARIESFPVLSQAAPGQLRTALHAYALEGHSPGQSLELVDR